MAGYTAISDTSKTLVEFIRHNCVPPVAKPELIGLCSPNETGSFTVGICLYDIEESADLRLTKEIVVDETHIQSPPFSVNLYYMIFTSLKSDINIRAYDEQRILGRIYQQLADNKIIETSFQGTSAESFNISLDNKTYEDKIKVWTAYNLPPRAALFYKINAVSIDSTKIREVKRVSSADVTLQHKDVRNQFGGRR